MAKVMGRVVLGLANVGVCFGCGKIRLPTGRWISLEKAGPIGFLNKAREAGASMVVLNDCECPACKENKTPLQEKRRVDRGVYL